MRGIKLKAFVPSLNKIVDVVMVAFEHSIIHYKTDEGNMAVQDKDLKLIQFTGLTDIHGNELYDQDIFEDLDGTRWKIYYDNELLSWEVTCLNDERFSNQALCEFIDRFEGKIRIDGLKKGNAFEHPHLSEGVK